MQINGVKLKEQRVLKGLSAHDIAKVAGLTARRIWQIETSEVSHVNDNIGNAICKRLKVKPQQLGG